MMIALREVVDGALLVEYPEASESDANRSAVALSQALWTSRSRGLLDAVPGARTLMLFYDPRESGFDRLGNEVIAASGRPSPRPRERRAMRIPVCYGGGGGPDLVELARELGCSPEEVTRRHADGSYCVAFIGFSPGFPYLSGLPSGWKARRLATPRARVPAGSVAIGGAYTGIYPQETPGGWRLIGRAPVRLFDPEETPPALLRPGDEVSFEPISGDELTRREASLRHRVPPASVATALFRVLAPGMWTSAQGASRFGRGSSGVPPGGAMDPRALAEGNARLGNPAGAAALEITMVGPELECLRSCRVAISGAPVEAEFNGTAVAAGQPHVMREGGRLRLGRTSGGARAYLCVEGGLEVSRVPPSRRLEKGDLIHAATEVPAMSAGGLDRRETGKTGPIRVMPGPQRERFRDGAIERLVSRPYRVSAVSDRRGVRLEGEPLDEGFDAEIPPEGTTLGAIQVPADGLPILLGPDRPITGGYAKIATILPEDWPKAAQALPGTELRFELVPPGRMRHATVGPASGR